MVMTRLNTFAGLITISLLNACSGESSYLEGLVFFPPVTPVTLVADAGPDQTVTDGDTVELIANAVAATNCHARFEWLQTSGPNVQIRFSVMPDMKFHAPPVSEISILNFQLKATCWDGSTDTDAITVVVEPTSDSALCRQAPTFATTYVWTDNGCTTDSADITGDTRIATIYRQEEAEPNDSHESANAIIFPNSISTERLGADVAGSVSGMAGSISDLSDFFIFTPPKTGSYEIFLCNDPLVCNRGTVSNIWILELRDQNFDPFALTNRYEVTELKLRVYLEAGLPYYLWVRVYEASWENWNYNLTILELDD
jgi:hypothetical protein